jgi:FtsP/CotA-like multicopper oxidase with cupredoxin domain
VRFFVTNACNARVLNMVTNKHMMKVVGSDHGKYAASVLSGGEILAPGERVVFEVMFKDSGTVQLYHQLPDRYLSMGTIEVGGDSVETDYGRAYQDETRDSALTAELEALRPKVLGTPDREILLTGTMDGHTMPIPKKSATERRTPAEAISHGPAAPPSPLDPAAALAKKAHDGWLGVEWYDTMGVMNSSSTPKNMHWVIRDRKTGRENHGIDWTFKKGQLSFVRIVNDSLAVHSMAHPIHFHGQRFAVLTVNGKPVQAPLAWKDTYLVGAGFTVDLVLETSNPGTWMAHCHISEHMEGMMMFHFKVEE